MTDCGVRGLGFKSRGLILTSRTETSSLSRVVRYMVETHALYMVKWVKKSLLWWSLRLGHLTARTVQKTTLKLNFYISFKLIILTILYICYLFCTKCKKIIFFGQTEKSISGWHNQTNQWIDDYWLDWWCQPIIEFIFIRNFILMRPSEEVNNRFVTSSVTRKTADVSEFRKDSRVVIVQEI